MNVLCASILRIKEFSKQSNGMMSVQRIIWKNFWSSLFIKPECVFKTFSSFFILPWIEMMYTQKWINAYQICLTELSAESFVGIQ